MQASHISRSLRSSRRRLARTFKRSLVSDEDLVNLYGNNVHVPVGYMAPVLLLIRRLNSWTSTLGPGSLQAQVGNFSADGGAKINIHRVVNFSADRGAKINIHRVDNFNIGWRVAAAAAASPSGCPGGSRAHSDASSSTPTRRATLNLAF